MNRGVGDYMAASGAPYKVWYDPGTKPFFDDADWLSFWNNTIVEHGGQAAELLATRRRSAGSATLFSATSEDGISART